MPKKLRAIVIGPFTSDIDLESAANVQVECGHTSFLLIADDDGKTTWLYRQVRTNADGDELIVDKDGSVWCDDAHRPGGIPEPRRLGKLLRWRKIAQPAPNT